MALTPQQIIDLKSQLKEQVEHLPQDKKAQALQQIESLSPEALELMIKQQQERPDKTNEPQKTIFRMIVDNDIQSVRVDENKFALAVFDINPISKAHCMIIPKSPVSDAKMIPNQAFSLAKKLAKKISLLFKAKSSAIQTESKFGEVIINLIPEYDSPLNINSSRSKAKMEELEEMGRLLRPKPKIQKIKIKRTNSQSQVLKIPRRIP